MVRYLSLMLFTFHMCLYIVLCVCVCGYCGFLFLLAIWCLSVWNISTFEFFSPTKWVTNFTFGFFSLAFFHPFETASVHNVERIFFQSKSKLMLLITMPLTWRNGSLLCIWVEPSKTTHSIDVMLWWRAN